MNRIIPERDLHEILLNVKQPGRYVGGEYGSISSCGENDFLMALSFPDLYEIGMSNQAVKILYREFNHLHGISCERVFAPDRDFEKALKENNVPLYTLESGIPLYDLDLLGFSVGYELSATTILTILEAGEIPLFTEDRTETAPLVLAGGPAITNPLPFAKFFDGVFLGEAEETFSAILMKLRDSKRQGGSRADALKIINDSDYIWTYGKHKKNIPARRALWNGFSARKDLDGIPVSSVAAVQDNGIIEIMRGCPNNCRFCHAGYFYRPYRQKTIDDILMEADFLVNTCGYNEITLSSLSSGDYNGLDILVKMLHEKFGDRKISFSLPSLRINSFTLALLQQLSIIRKSGLTFAVETPDPEWQKKINKEVTLERTVEILKEAKKQGWKVAKFYFMVGLPVGEESENSEEEKIADFIMTVQKVTGIRLNVNVGTFIPKPHTPFQWSRQLTVEESYRKLTWLKAQFKRNPQVKLSYHTPFVSFLEGVISRGDERVGDLIFEAYKKGARLEAWTEYFRRDLWENIFHDADWNIEEEICSRKSVDDTLPWDTVNLGVHKKYIEHEYKKSMKGLLTERCTDTCQYKCGICHHDVKPVDNHVLLNEKKELDTRSVLHKRTSVKYLFKFTKGNKAVYLSHINVMNIFQKAFQRSSIFLEYSKGFNPKPKLEFAHPLSLGISSREEVGSVIMHDPPSCRDFLETVNKHLPEGIRLIDCREMPPYIQGTKKYSLMSLYGGSRYEVRKNKNNRMDLSVVMDALKNYIHSKQADEKRKKRNDFSITLLHADNDDFLELFLPATGTKLSNILFILKDIYGPEECNRLFSIERIATYAFMHDTLSDYFTLPVF